MATRAAKTTAKKTATPAKKTTAARAPRTRKTTTAKKTTPARLSLVKNPSTQIPVRRKPFMTDVQGYATLAARLVGITTPSIRDWRDHRNNTATRPLHDGSTLHYNLDTRTLTWQAICPMGAVHAYCLDSPSTASAARVHADRCQQTHADLTTIPALTADELEALGLLQTPTWARPDELAGEITATIPVPAEPLKQAIASAADTQPMSTQAIADHIAKQLADQQPKEHPQP